MVCDSWLSPSKAIKRRVYLSGDAADDQILLSDPSAGDLSTITV